MVDIAEFPVPARAADEVDQPRVIVLGIAEERLVDQRGVRAREIGPHQGIGQDFACPDRRIDLPVVRVAVPEEKAGVPEDRRARLQGPARGRAEVRSGHRAQGRVGPAGKDHGRHVVRPELTFPTRVDERRSDDELLGLAALDDGRRRRSPRIFLPEDVFVFHADQGDRGRVVRRPGDRSPGRIRHHVLFGGQDEPPPEVGAEILETVPADVGAVGDVRDFTADPCPDVPRHVGHI